MSLFKFSSLICELDNDLVAIFFLPFRFDLNHCFYFMKSIGGNQSNQILWIYKYKSKLDPVELMFTLLFVSSLIDVYELKLFRSIDEIGSTLGRQNHFQLNEMLTNKIVWTAWVLFKIKKKKRCSMKRSDKKTPRQPKSSILLCCFSTALGHAK